MASPNQPSTAAAAAQMQQQARLLYTERVLDGSQQDIGVRVLHLNNPDSLNSLTNDMAAEFTAELQQLKADSAMRALIVTGQVGCDQAYPMGLRCCSCNLGRAHTECAGQQCQHGCQYLLHICIHNVRLLRSTTKTCMLSHTAVSCPC
jgi:hypothetical protein